MTEPHQVIHGPTQEMGGTVLYQVTLPSGMVVTNPSGFAPQAEREPDVIVVADDAGTVLAVESKQTPKQLKQ